ncbi:uncharacterized protein LOC121517054 [Cheilinus undulatus]|uniref:uncharacterized protein LOC121517054 n=1 Tax=Cheilinus undulatus TaxID=241271 RepID=UPI001BD63B2B|nr:uncharacterized protein LOC121517054 [Cheilinus undulatus]
MNPEILLSKMSLKPGSAVTVVILLMIVSSAQTLTCGSTEFWINNRCCPLCPPGSHVDEVCTDSTSTSCSSCTEGTFMDHHTNLPWCYDCSTCDTGSGLKIKTPCRRNSNTVCEPLEGFYCIKFAGGSCWEAQKHRSCEPGEYIRETGTSSSDTVCSRCSAGTFSDGTFTSCRPHTQCKLMNLQQHLKPGTEAEDAQCEFLHSFVIFFILFLAFLGIIQIVVVVLATVHYLQRLWRTILSRTPTEGHRNHHTSEERQEEEDFIVKLTELDLRERTLRELVIRIREVSAAEWIRGLKSCLGVNSSTCGSILLVDMIRTLLGPQRHYPNNKEINQFTVAGAGLESQRLGQRVSSLFLSRMTLNPGSAILLMIVSSAQTLTCRPPEFQIGDRCCPQCPPGSLVDEACTDSSSTRCVSCSEGTFMDHPSNRTRCYDCRSCDTGSGLRMNASCTETSDTVCEPLEGFYCIESAENSCLQAIKHTSCRPGEYIRENGTSVSDTVCSRCSAGTFSDGMFTSCQPHKRCASMQLKEVKPGTKSEDAQCGGLRSEMAAVIAIVSFIGVIISLVIAYFAFAFYNGNMPSVIPAQRFSSLTVT